MRALAEFVLTTRVDLVDVEAATRMIAAWAHERKGRMVCAANVHMVMEARDDRLFGAQINDADLVVADGRPLVWVCRLRGHRTIGHVRGLDLTAHLCEIATTEHLNVGLYGGEAATARAVQARLQQEHEGLNVTFCRCPPFRPQSPEEAAADIQAIGAADVNLLLVALGCPKQELWMAAHRGQVHCVMVGVGAVFDMLGGRRRVAPVWAQRAGLEWAYRLLQEPRRLWRRYTKHNARFVVHVAAQLARAWCHDLVERRRVAP